jgi:hypothetical protein
LAIVRAIANFAVDYTVLLEINHKIVVMGGVEVSSSHPKTMARVKSGGNPHILKIPSSGKKKVSWETPSVSSPTRKQNSVSLSTPLVHPLHSFTPQRSPSSHCGREVEAPRS